MHRLIAPDGPPGGMERAKSQAWINAAFHKTMVLFHHIVYVFALPQCTTRWELALLLKGLEDWRIHSIFVDRDDAWGGRMLRPERLPEEALSGASITPGTQQKVDGLARGIDGTVEIILPLLDLDIRLINATRVIGLREMGATTLVEFGSIPLDPPKDGGVIDSDPAFPQ
jgi:hypothetical protein